MNRRPPGLQLEETIFGFINYKSAEGLSPLTIRSYQTDLNTWLEYQGNTPISKITTKNIRDYLLYMRHEYVPRRITGGNDRKLSGKTIRNIWITLSAFFRWATDEFKMENPMRGVAPPKYNDPPVEPFSTAVLPSDPAVTTTPCATHKSPSVKTPKEMSPSSTKTNP